MIIAYLINGSAGLISYAVAHYGLPPPATHENRKYLERIKVGTIDVANSGVNGDHRDGFYDLLFSSFELYLISLLLLRFRP